MTGKMYTPWWYYVESVFENYKVNKVTLRFAINDAIYSTPNRSEPVSGGRISNPPESRAMMLTSQRIEQLRREVEAVEKTVKRLEAGDVNERKAAYWVNQRYFFRMNLPMPTYKQTRFKKMAFFCAARFLGLM